MSSVLFQLQKQVSVTETGSMSISANISLTILCLMLESGRVKTPVRQARRPVGDDMATTSCEGKMHIPKPIGKFVEAAVKSIVKAHCTQA